MPTHPNAFLERIEKPVHKNGPPLNKGSFRSQFRKLHFYSPTPYDRFQWLLHVLFLPSDMKLGRQP